MARNKLQTIKNKVLIQKSMHAESVSEDEAKRLIAAFKAIGIDGEKMDGNAIVKHITRFHELNESLSKKKLVEETRLENIRASLNAFKDRKSHTARFDGARTTNRSIIEAGKSNMD